MRVIAGMIGIPESDWQRFKGWSDSIIRLSYARQGDAEASQSVKDFGTTTVEMNEYVTSMIAERRQNPQDDLLTRLVEAEVNGEHLTQEEILGFFQLLVVGGQETTTNLINNALLCFIEHPQALAEIRAAPALLPSAIEEVLRYRAPFQWVMRAPRREVELSGQKIPAGKLTLPVIGAANRDEGIFPNLAFGHGIHSCLGAALARMEARIALSEFLSQVSHFELLKDEPWEPRKALHVHGPTRLWLRLKR
jgi:cytochrome P450